MINVCIVRPKNYVHYQAFIEIVELLHFSLLDLNYKSQITFNYFDEKPESLNIVFGAHLLNDDLIDIVPKNTVIFNTEQIESITKEWSSKLLKLASKKIKFWDYSKYNLDYLFKKIQIKGELFQIGYQKELHRIEHKKNKDIDVLFYGSVNPRRKEVLDELIKKKVKVKSLFGVYGKERDDIIANSKIILNMHMYDSKIFEIIRVFYLLTNGIAVVSEVGENTKYNNDYLNYICSCHYENLEERIFHLLKNDDERETLAINGLNRIKKFPQHIFTNKIISNVF